MKIFVKYKQSLLLRNKFVIIASLAISFLYFLLRVPSLTKIPVFVDEAIYIRWAQVMQNEPTLRFLPLSDGKQPFFMWLIIPFLKVFSDPLVAGRMVSVLAGFGTLVGVVFLAWYLFKSPKAAFVAGLLYAASPFAVFFDRMALVDSMLSMFGVWTLFFGVVTARALRLDTAQLAGFSLGGALLTKSPALFFSLLLPVTALLAPFREKGNSVKVMLLSVLKLVGLFTVTYAIGYAMYNVLRLGPNFGLIGERNKDYVFPLSHLWTNPKDPFIFYIDRIREWLFILGPSVLVILVIAGVIIGLKKYPRQTLILTAWAFLPLLAQAEFAKVITARYILFSIPFLVTLAALSVLPKNKIYQKIFIVGLLIFLANALRTDYLLLTNPEAASLPQSERSGYLEEWTSGTGIREVAEFIKEKKTSHPNERIVVGTEGFFGTLPDGLQIYLENVPNVTVIGVGVIIKEVPESLKNAKRAGDTVYLVANSSRMLNKFERDATKAVEVGEKLGLKVVGSYPKAIRARTDTHEYIWYGERDYLYLFEVTPRALILPEEEEQP